MKSATKSAPRFRVGDWVSYEFGAARILGQIIEDRGLLGDPERRLYRIRLDHNQPAPGTTEAPEEELEPAPEAILAAEAARQKGFSTSNWPCLKLDLRYIRQGKSNHWMALPEFRHVVEGAKEDWAAGYTPTISGVRRADDDDFASVTVLREFDPRLRDPRDHPGLLHALTQEARRLADEMFQAGHRNAVIDRDPLDAGGRP